MRHCVPVCLLCIIALAMAGCASASAGGENRALPAKPTVLVIGDSISMQGGYLPALVERLEPRYRVLHNLGNGGDSANVLRHLERWVSTDPPDIIHFNCGLHDIKFDRTRKARQVPPETYEYNLRQLVRFLKTQTHARLVFGLTTPVNDEWHRAKKSFDRREVDVQRYNAIARTVMSEAGIPVNDLHKVIVEFGADACLREDGVHMKKRANELLAEAVASAIERVAGRPDPEGSEE